MLKPSVLAVLKPGTVAPKPGHHRGRTGDEAAKTWASGSKPPKSISPIPQRHECTGETSTLGDVGSGQNHDGERLDIRHRNGWRTHSRRGTLVQQLEKRRNANPHGSRRRRIQLGTSRQHSNGSSSTDRRQSAREPEPEVRRVLQPKGSVQPDARYDHVQVGIRPGLGNRRKPRAPGSEVPEAQNHGSPHSNCDKVRSNHILGTSTQRSPRTEPGITCRRRSARPNQCHRRTVRTPSARHASRLRSDRRNAVRRKAATRV